MDKIKELYEVYQKSIGISWENLLKDNGILTKSPYYILNKLGLRAKNHLDCQRKQELREDFFEKIDTPEKSYWLGFMFADGNVCQRGKSFRVKIGFNFNNKAHLEKFSQIIYGQNKVKTYKNRKYEDISELVFSSKKMGEDLIFHGCVPRKSPLIRMPKIDSHLMRFFILGFFDGDGHISIRKNGGKTVGFTSNEGFLKELMKLFEENLSIKSKIFLRKGIYGSLVFHRKEYVETIKNYFYSENDLFLERKKNLFFA